MKNSNFKLSLRFRHPKIAPDFVESSIQMQSLHKWKSGEPITTPKGKKLDGIRNENYCCFRISTDGEDIIEALNKLNKILVKKVLFIDDYITSGGTIEYYLSVYCEDGGFSEEFDNKLLADIARNKINFGLEIL